MNLNQQVDALEITLLSHTSIDRPWLDKTMQQLRAAIHRDRVFERLEGKMDGAAEAQTDG